MNNTLKFLRKQIHDIVVYSEGSFTIKELYQLPFYQITEILDTFKEKSQKQQDALDAASGKNKRTF